MIRAFLKRNGILLATLLIYAGTVAGVALAIDLLVYQAEKKNLLTRFFPEDLFPSGMGKFMELADRWQNETREGREEGEALKALTALAGEVVSGPSSVFRITIQRPDGAILFDRTEDKFARFNHRRNSLWLRNFHVKRLRQMPGRDASGAASAIWIYFTTPEIDTAPLEAQLKSLPSTPSALALAAPLKAKIEKLKALPVEIEELTARFRRMIYLVAAGITLPTALLVFFILLPARNVVAGIEGSTAGDIRFIRRPRALLERLYNAMARDAVLARLQERLSALVNEGGASSARDLVEAAAEELTIRGAAGMTAHAEFESANGGAPSPAGPWNVRRNARWERAVAAPGLEGALATGFLSPPALEALKTGAGFWLETAPKGGRAAGRWLADPERPGRLHALALALDAPRRSKEAAAAEELLARVEGILRSGMEALRSRHRSLSRERDRASIGLSRNLGHDLTNIIAAAKLDLSALRTLLGKGQPPPEGERREILMTSLEGLFGSMKFLQEVVNLYRAYAFLKKPVFEPCDLNELASETIRLFGLSGSRNVEIVERFAPVPPRAPIDPRLFKLALFNLFTNAYEAIRRSAPEGGTIVVTTAETPGGVEIEVEDNGPGFRNRAGEPASPAEIDRVFDLGYTTRPEGEGEGLGLNWVRTIVRDIHEGSIRAERAPAGGAKFILIFPAARREAREEA